ncbi:MAG: hypothetical protein ABJH98_00665 [Reichenbachiella sp.]|uniref:hypothetical protein n=1 Tax=Reichenbachiella sp. TaxID=2184521 RepID=UPI003299AF80
MEATIHITSFLGYSSLAILLVGLLYKPWVVLWWHDIQNRWLVIKYYGTATVVFFLLKILLNG